MKPAAVTADFLVETRGLGKSYPLVFRSRDRLRALLRLLVGRGQADTISVLQDVNLQVRRGESLGLIGENGAGKSTLLKLIIGVLTPTDGQVAVTGRIGALLELGAGFHPEYTGRDNIGPSAALYGLDADEVRAKLHESSNSPTSAATSTSRSNTIPRAWSFAWVSQSLPRCIPTC